MLFGAEARFPDVCECGWGGVPSGRPFLDLRASWRHYRTPPQLRRHTILMKTLVAVGVIGLLLGFGGGVLTGRLFPTHHFERYGEADICWTAQQEGCAIRCATLTPILWMKR
jgi:hypothetical protein